MQSSEPRKTIELWQMLVDRSLIHFNEVYQRMGVLLTNDDLTGESKYESALQELANKLARLDFYSRKATEQKWFILMVGKSRGEPLSQSSRGGWRLQLCHNV